MYALYEKVADGEAYRYRLIREGVSLFGCRRGYIPWFLARSLDKTASEPFRWHLAVSDALRAADLKDRALIINLKPHLKEPRLSLYEVVEVSGCSAFNWTPIMLYLRALFVDEDPSEFDVRDFVRSSAEVDDPVFSMMYLRGTVRNGQIEGPWTPPGPSPTNSVLLWPGAFQYFAQQAHSIMERTGTALIRPEGG